MISKDLTLIYSDSAEKSIFKPIAEEAEKRGYKVTLTDDKFAKCEIGFYCQHVNFPQFSKFSVIMLHDIIQQYGNWPDIWLREPWNKYDIGFLPSNQWVNNWNQCSQWYYANPRKGMYKAGWPKADNYAGIDRESYKKEFNRKHGIDDKKPTILYAPAWENDNKQDDFVQSMLKLDVNILIKQANVDPNYSPQYYAHYHEVLRMSEMHKDIVGVTILDPTTNIFEAIMASDVLVSEESSTMCEATMMGIPAVSVSNWLIPDTDPKRFPECDYDFVFMTTKEDLTDFISGILGSYGDYVSKVNAFREAAFGDIGGSAKIIMDVIDDCVEGRPVRYEALKRRPEEKVPKKQLKFHRHECIKREMYYNYNKRSKLFHFFYEPVRKLKKKAEGRE